MNAVATPNETPPAQPRRTLLLVDGSSYLYRAYHAMPDLRAVPDDPGSAATGAIRGMVNMLRTLRKEFAADYAVCVFDAKGPTFRDAIYPQYKAQRSPMPDDLREQIAPIHAVVRMLGWPVLDVPGVEADDVIGTLAVIAARQGIEVIISSGDKDLAQLVDQHITIVDTMNGKRRDLAGVEAEFGVPARLMVDFQTLVGDTVDNVPGVPKVGPKTAAKWLTEYGSLDALVANADAIKGVVGQNLRSALDWLPTGRSLLTVRTDCDLDEWVSGLPSLETIRFGEPDVDGLKQFYETYGFKGLARTVAAATAEATSTDAGDTLFDASAVTALIDPDTVNAVAVPTHYETIVDWDRLDAWIARLRSAPLAAVDTETTSLDEMRAEIVGVSFSIEPGEAAYVPLAHAYPGVPDQLPRDAVLARL
ncbi:MAG: 5'-3' exonuclease H3TH domain-containing protein, partial [Burkholderiaceae bacterium]